VGTGVSQTSARRFMAPRAKEYRKNVADNEGSNGQFLSSNGRWWQSLEISKASVIETNDVIMKSKNFRVTTSCSFTNIESFSNVD
jgi:hypothetical protein